MTTSIFSISFTFMRREGALNNTAAGEVARSCQLKWLKQGKGNYCGARCHQEADNSNCSLLNELYKGKYFSI